MGPRTSRRSGFHDRGRENPIIRTTGRIAIIVLTMTGGLSVFVANASALGGAKPHATHSAGAKMSAGSSSGLDTSPQAVGAAPVVPAGAKKVSGLPGTTSLRIEVVLKPQNPNGLLQYAEAVSSIGSPLYHHYLDTAEFASSFAPNPQTVETVDSALRAEGLSPGPLSADHLAISVHATALSVSSALKTSFERYRLQSGRIAFANTGPPELPAYAAPDVETLLGLDDLIEAQPAALRVEPAATHEGPDETPAVSPQVQTGGPQPCAAAGDVADTYTADQIASAYGLPSLYGQGDQGQGETVALIEAETDLSSDIAAYQTCYGTDTSVSTVSVDGGASLYSTPEGSGEAALDIEQVIGLAPKAHIVVYQAPPSLDYLYDAYLDAISSDTAQVISSSWGTCEGFAVNQPDVTFGGQPWIYGLFQAENTLFEEAAVQGQSVLAAAGDDGSEGCDPWVGDDASFSSQLYVQDPSAQPFVTGVGGTTLAADDDPPGETTWNSYHAGGGGISALWPMPDYQADAPSSVGVIDSYSSGGPCSNGGGYCREVPDVSADSDPYTGYPIYWDGEWIDVGGTSAAAPLWAALLALTDASSACGGQAIGFANPALYAVAAEDPGAFNNITTGNNDYTGQDDGAYPAQPGYNMATGLGTPTANLPPALCAAFDPAPLQFTSPSSAALTLGSQADVTVTTSGSPIPALSESGALPPGTSFTDNGDGTATISGTSTETGTYSLELTASGGTSSATQVLTVVVGSASQITSPASLSFASGSQMSQLTASGSPASSFFVVGGTLPSGLVLTSTGSLFEDPAGSVAAGTYSVTVEAENGISPAATQALTIAVDGTPSFSSGDTATFASGSPGSFTITTIAAPTPSLSESGRLPSGMGFTDNANGTATISGTPTGTGTFSCTITAANGEGTATQTLSIDVDDEVQAPIFNSPDSTTFVQMQRGTFQFTATGVPAPTFSIVSGSYPIGPSGWSTTEWSFTSAGLLTGLPYWYSGGTYNLVVEASNGVSPPAYQNFTLVVEDPPSILPDPYTGMFAAGGEEDGVSASADLVLDQSGSIGLQASGYPLPTLSATGLPPGTTFVDYGNGDGAISGTPTESGDFTVTVTATNAAGSAGTTLGLAVAQAVAPQFLSSDQGTIDTASWPCSQLLSFAGGFPYPKVTETGALPSPLVAGDIPAAENWDPSTVDLGAAGCPDPGTASAQITVDASNSAGTTSQAVTLNAFDQAASNPTKFTSPDSATFRAYEYNAFLFQVPAGSKACVTLSDDVPPFLRLGDWGELSGVPETAGTYDMTVTCDYWKGTAENPVRGQVTQQFTLTVLPPVAPVFVSVPSPSFALGFSSQCTITTTGSPVASLSESGALPPGTTFVDNGNGTATISGTPTETGSFPLSVMATNEAGSVTQSLTITVAQPEAPQFTSADAVTFEYGTSSQFPLEATGFPPPSFSLVSGNLPPGLTLSSGGVITGTPGATGSYPVVVEAANGFSPDAVQALSIMVDETPSFITAPTTTKYTGGPPISVTVDAVGDPAVTLTATDVPPGMSFVDNGPVTGSADEMSATISGVPDEVGTFGTTISASNSVGSTSAVFVFDISALPLEITTSTLPEATVGTAYRQPLQAAGGNPGYSWELTSGSLPKGLNLGKSTGFISGRPATSDTGTYTITVEVLDKKIEGDVPPQNSATETLSLTVGQRTPVITSVDPSTGPTTGGAAVVIKGSNLENASSVMFGADPATAFVVNGTGSEVIASSPPEPAGSVSISVTTPSGTAVSATQYTYS